MDITTFIQNNVLDHRLRVLFPTDTHAAASYAETAFDIVDRNVSLPDHRGWKEDPQPTHPQLGFAGARSDGRSLTVANRGLTEYELRGDDRSTLALTLLRCVEWGSRGDLTNTVRAHREDGSPGTNYMFTPGAQCQGTHEFRYSVVPGCGHPVLQLELRQAYNHKVDLVAHQRKIPANSVMTGCFFEASLPAAAVPSTLKVSENESQLVARLTNVSSDDATAWFCLEAGMDAAALLNLAEDHRVHLQPQNGEVAVHLPPRSIVTVGIVPVRGEQVVALA